MTSLTCNVYKEPFLVEVFIVLLLFIICCIWSTHFDSELGRFVGKSRGMAHGQPTSAVRALQLELKKINDEPVEGFQVRLANDDNIFEWQVAIFGPPGTLYEGGYFKVTFCLLLWIFIYPFTVQFVGGRQL